MTDLPRLPDKCPVPSTSRAPLGLSARSLSRSADPPNSCARAPQSGRKTSFRRRLVASAWAKSIISTVALCCATCLKPRTYAGARMRRHAQSRYPRMRGFGAESRRRSLKPCSSEQKRQKGVVVCISMCNRHVDYVGAGWTIIAVRRCQPMESEVRHVQHRIPSGIVLRDRRPGPVVVAPAQVEEVAHGADVLHRVPGAGVGKFCLPQ